MRRLRATTDKERGATGVLVAVLMLVLIGAGAMAVDVGQIYVERAELQNGADAGALATGKSCAKSTGCTQASALSTASGMANANARDAASNARVVELSSGKVTVATSTKDGKSGAGTLSKMFASALQAPAVTVGASATAVWGSPVRGPVVLPIAMSRCEFTEYGYKGNRETVMRFDNDQDTTCSGRGGAEIAGGFFWIQDDAGKCAVSVDVSNPNAVTPRATSLAFPESCRYKLEGLKTASTVLVPLFDVNYPQNVSYTRKTGFGLYTFAAFKITGWKLSKTDSTLTWNMPSSQCGSTCLGIKGIFTEFVTDAAGFDLGGPVNGASVVKLVK